MSRKYFIITVAVNIPLAVILLLLFFGQKILTDLVTVRATESLFAIMYYYNLSAFVFALVLLRPFDRHAKLGFWVSVAGFLAAQLVGI